VQPTSVGVSSFSKKLRLQIFTWNRGNNQLINLDNDGSDTDFWEKHFSHKFNIPHLRKSGRLLDVIVMF